MTTNIDLVTLEILKISKDLLVNEYIDRRAKDHNKWIVESEHLWKTQRLRLAYPEMSPYPTEDDVVRKAQKMLEFVKSNSEGYKPVTNSTTKAKYALKLLKPIATDQIIEKISEPVTSNSVLTVDSEKVTTDRSIETSKTVEESPKSNPLPEVDNSTVTQLNSTPDPVVTETKTTEAVNTELNATPEPVVTQPTALERIKNFKLSDDDLEYYRYRTEHKIDEELTSTNKLMPAIMEKINELRNDYM